MVVPDTPGQLPDFVSWPSFPFEGDLRVKPLEPIATTEPPREGEEAGSCVACAAPDEAYIWVSERWRVRAMDRPSGLPMVLILESRSHLDLGDLPNLLAAELGVMTVRLERAIRSLDGVARVHVNRWGDGSAHLHLWFLARPRGRLQLRGSFLSLWDEILPSIPEGEWRESLALVAAWLAEFGGRPLAEPPRIEWQAPSTFTGHSEISVEADLSGPVSVVAAESPVRPETPARSDDDPAHSGVPAQSGATNGTSGQGPSVPAPRVSTESVGSKAGVPKATAAS
jgi:diadenosine tetraphosphate (Ap4A) HIT family hydrolase